MHAGHEPSSCSSLAKSKAGWSCFCFLTVCPVTSWKLATSGRLGFSAKTMGAIKKGEFVDIDLILSECSVMQNLAGMGLQTRENISSPSPKTLMPLDSIR